MGIKIFKNRLSGQVVKMSIPEYGSPNQEISYVDASNDRNSGYCDFEYHATEQSVVITYILARPKASGLGALLLSEVTNHAMHGFPSVTNVVAEYVLDESRGFYLQHGFHPTRGSMKLNNGSVPPPGDEVNFASRYFQAKGAEAVIYQATNGRSVTRHNFSNRIEAGRNAPDWEASPITVLARARQKSAHWEELVP